MLKKAVFLATFVAIPAAPQAQQQTDVLLIHNRSGDPAVSIRYAAPGIKSGNVDLRKATSIDGERFRLEVPVAAKGTLFTFTMTTKGGRKLVRGEIDPNRIHHLDFDSRKRWNEHDYALDWIIRAPDKHIYAALGSIRRVDGAPWVDIPETKLDGLTVGQIRALPKPSVKRGVITYWMAEHFLGEPVDGADEIWTEIKTECGGKKLGFEGVRSILFRNEEKIGEVKGPKYFQRFSHRHLMSCNQFPFDTRKNQFVSSQWETVRGL